MAEKLTTRGFFRGMIRSALGLGGENPVQTILKAGLEHGKEEAKKQEDAEVIETSAEEAK